jgi:hypothetical protein
MESTIATTPQSMNYNAFHNRALICVASALDVEMSDMISNSKRRDVANAKSIYCSIMLDRGYTKSEVARYLNADNRTVYHYIEAHQIRIKEQGYKTAYEKALVFLDEYAKDITDYDHAINDLRKMVMELQRKYEHLKELLLN